MGLLSAIGGITGSFLGGPIGGTIGSSLGGMFEGEEAVGQASSAQQASYDAGIAEQRRQFDLIQKLMEPYVAAGTPALQQQQAFLGLSGPEAERAAIERIRGGETFGALARQGEEALLQQASATGGLRGGNIQAALAQFRPQLLSGLLDQQYNRLAGMTSLGQNAAAGVGNAGMQTGANIANLYGQIGSAQAAGIVGQQNAMNIPGLFGMAQGYGGFGNIFGDGGSGGGGSSTGGWASSPGGWSSSSSADSFGGGFSAGFGDFGF